MPLPPLTEPTFVRWPTIPGFEIVEELGRGGMGVVYKARQLALGRYVALKMIRDAAYARPDQLARFRTEARSVARLQHPNIVQIHEIGAHEAQPFLALEFVDGVGLNRKLRGGPLAPEQAAQIVETLARAAHHAHLRGIVHRDLKPANVLLTTDGDPKITDFGLAKQLGTDGDQTQSGMVLGTPAYMAPEQAGGQSKDIGPHTDVYALGAILYELLTGRPPFRVTSLAEAVEQVRFQEPISPARLRPGLPGDLETICLKALAKEPAERYESALALANDLARFQAGEPILARRGGSLHELVRWLSRAPSALGVVIGTAAMIALVSAGDGARYRLDERLERVGKNLIIIRAGGRMQQGMAQDFKPLTRKDADAIRRQVGSLLVGVAELQVTQRKARVGDKAWRTNVVGTTPELARVRDWTLAHGEWFSDEGVERLAPVCLIGQTVRKKLFPDKTNPVGLTLRIDQVDLRVVGVLNGKGKNPLGVDQDDQMFVPLSTVAQRITATENLSMLIADLVSENLREKACEEITRVLREEHGLENDEEDFDVQSITEMAQIGTMVTKTLHILIAVLAAISLALGGIGIMNSVLVSVAEQKRRIAMRMSLGATRRDVMTGFLTEAVLIALLGAFIGVPLGIGAAIALAYNIGWPLVVRPEVVLLAFGVTVATGVLFGFYPAWKASRLGPRNSN
jgi:ABC-type antimicrobial peptide transport system permease subunit/tRNA A-37 threonylcarbamoyl transferase component Bud32